jgi:hypothetical protein
METMEALKDLSPSLLSSVSWAERNLNLKVPYGPICLYSAAWLPSSVQGREQSRPRTVSDFSNVPDQCFQQVTKHTHTKIIINPKEKLSMTF